MNAKKVFDHPLYQDALKTISYYERDRVYCGHDLGHFLDVARMMYIWNLEEGLGYSKDIIYTAALIHDIGRAREYESGQDHHLASYEMGKVLLENTDFSQEDKDLILDAVLKHREKKDQGPFASLLYKADKESRRCMVCPARATCYWPDEKKNLELKI